MQTEREFTSRRYQIGKLLGAGTMGQIYQAYDRLTGNLVALKQVVVAPRLLAFGSRPPDDDPQALLLALAHEFRTLASLRHPHIISVLDYGFDAQRRPFFTMELLSGAQSILEAGCGAPLDQQLDLLLQASEALAYLHRRGILHHDLKPANVLVAQERLRLLDFGLAVDTGQERADDAFGTVLYLPPEVLDGRPYTAAADLYSLGVIAYELLVGRHPFPADTLRAYLDLVFDTPPDLAPLAARPALAELVGRLLAKAPEARPASAQDVIAALRQIRGRPEATEQPAIRESYLQAASFVGRAAELAQLRGALAGLMDGQGGLWLLGGESGVGKSRLLDELRAEALVANALVVTGQAVEGGRLPYQLWREPLRRLVLEVELSDREASVLKQLVPNLEWLLERPVVDIAALSGEAGRLRLHLAVADVLRRLRRPLLLLLEDLQWSGEELGLLNDLRRLLHDAPLLVVGSYRAEERPSLPDELPGATILPLTRLARGDIAALSQAILGPVGTHPEMLQLLQQESEGNTFFLIEVVRALAEEVGSLERIDHTALPARVVPGGVRQIVRRRLGRVPSWARGLLEIAAVAGRELDLAVLERLAGLELDAWLRAGADAAVLEVAEGRWRFAHDKLREQLLDDLPEAARPALHRRVAEAIEATYPEAEARRIYAEALLEHWRGASEAARALDYVLILIPVLTDYSNDYRQASQMAEQGATLLAELPPDERAPYQLQLHLLRGAIGAEIAAYDAALESYRQAQFLARTLGDTRAEAEALLGLAIVATRSGQLDDAAAQVQAGLALATALGDPLLQAKALRILGLLTYWGGQFEQARVIYQEALVAVGLAEPLLRANMLNDLAVLEGDLGNSALALAGFQEALAISESIGSDRSSALYLTNIAYELISQGKVAEAHQHIERNMVLARRIGNQAIVSNGLRMLGREAEAQGDLPRALGYYEQSLAAAQTDGTWILINESLIAVLQLQARLQPGLARATLGHLLQHLTVNDSIRQRVAGIAAAAYVLWSNSRHQFAAELLSLIETTPYAVDDLRKSVAWLWQELASALDPAVLLEARECGANRGIDTTLTELRAWLEQGER
jgi:tetratricopeptide (TPR) repeat protein